ncbi:MAG: transcriptional coactivator p15/PC4 family protein [Calditrichaeota bacterium]|nr:transcriptional coactivator p15/PC4 family protein [Calditrichota bacterium]
MSDGLIHEIEKNSTEVIRFSRTEFRGKPLIDIRVFYQDDDGEYKPTKKGITFSPEIFDEFLEGIEKLKEGVE